VFNPDGIPVVYVASNVKSDAFFLSQLIDTGFFNYDLFFRPTGSGIFELRSFLGSGAFVLPQLDTAMQDMWHQGSETWFDRSTDLRVLLNGGGAVLSDDNQATLVSTGTTFRLEDDLQDVWGEVSAWVNFFNPSANTSV
jgi:autotransporter family porin